MPAGNRKKAKHKIQDQRSTMLIRFAKWSMGLFFMALMLFALLLLLVRLGIFGDLPDIQSLKSIKNNTASEVFSADGKLMGRYYIENRLTINNRNISPHVINALIATEDRRYFDHEGVDYLSLGRVVLKSVLLGNRAHGGGSTISQQLARNLFPREGQGWWHLIINKSKEAFVAIRLEKIYSKEEILNLYLNTVPFGENIYGIETAAQRFFSIPSARLNPAQAATLIGMLAANTAYNPRLHPERSINRRNLVLRRMHEEGFMEQDEFQQWMALPLDLSYRKIDQNTGIAPYYRDHLEQSLLAILKDHHSDTINLYTDGLRIVTSIHSGVQEKAEHALEQHMKQLQMEFLEHWAGRDPWEGNPEFFLEQVRQSPSYKRMESSGMPAKAILETMKDDTAVFPDENGILKKVSPLDSVRMGLLTLHSGFLAIDPSNGQILAWIGGIDHRYYQFDHVTSKRQVGSIFKPFVYAAALQNGMKPCDFISNEQRLYEMYDGWSPSNADGKHDGYYSLKGGLTHSINTVTAELVVRIGPETVVELARKTGIRSDLPVVPSIALGSAELSLLEVISAYTCFIRDGTPIEPWSLLRIEDREGRILYRHSVDTESEPALDQETSLMMVEMLKNVVDSGTARSARTVFDIEAELAGKTGTTQDQGDGWFIGFTPGLLAGAWVGASFPSIHFRTTDLGQGAHTALPIVARFYRLMEQDEKYRTYTSGSFAPLPDELAAALDCPDYSLEDPEMNFFERLFRRDADRDSIRFQQREERRTEREEYKNQLEEEGVTGIKKAIKLLFGKRKNAEHTDSTNQK